MIHIALKKTAMYFGSCLLLFCFCLPSASQAQTYDYDKIDSGKKSGAEKFCEAMLAQENAEPFKYAFSAFFLNRNLEQANQRIIDEINSITVTLPINMHERDASGKARAPKTRADLADNKELMPDQAGSEYVKWKMRLINRIYYYFNDKSSYYPGRLSPEAQTAMENLLYKYACKKSVVARMDYLWVDDSSENHQMMANANAFLAVQTLKNLPDYKDKQMPDGKTMMEHYEGWVNYFKRYCSERARWGLLWEIHSPTYGKWLVPDFMNICDFAEDAALRENSTKLMHLIWADWSLDQINLITGGGKTRSYLNNYSQIGEIDSWHDMAKILLAENPEFITGNQKGFAQLAKDNSAIQTPFIFYTSGYKIPKIVFDLMLDKEKKGAYVYQSIRPGREGEIPEDFPRDIFQEPKAVRLMQADDSRCVKYSYVTPHFLLGSIWVDPNMKYGGGPGQNRWQGIVFDTGPNARVFPQCVSAYKDKANNYNQHISIQHENVMIVAKNTFSSRQTLDNRVFFANGMKDRLTRHGDWYCLQEGASYLAVLPATYSSATLNVAQWDDANWLRMTDDSTPIVFVAAEQKQFSALADFLKYLDAQRYKVTDGNRLDYVFLDSKGNQTTLTIHKDVRILPQINGKEINLKPDFTFDSPYLSSPRGSGIATIRFGDESMVIDLSDEKP